MADSASLSAKSAGIKTLFERVIFEDGERGTQFRVRVCQCSDAGALTRIAVSRFWWHPTEKKWLPTAKSHCFLPLAAWHELGKVHKEVTGHIPKFPGRKSVK